MLATTVAVHDIDDAEGFVAATIRRSGIQLSEDEREELLAEGIRILFELSQRFEPRRGNHAQDGRFSGFAAQFLPRKLGDAWHRWNPDHRYVTGEDGKRTWVYYPKPVSIEALNSPGGERGGEDWEGQIREPGAWSPAEPSPSRPRAHPEIPLGGPDPQRPPG